MKIILLLACTAISISIKAQSDTLKVLDHNDFLIWKTIQDPKIHPEGKVVSYRLVPGEGDPSLLIYDTERGQTDTIHRVSKYAMDYEGEYLISLVTPHRDSLRLLERKKVEKKKWPSDTLVITSLTSQSEVRIPYVMQFKSPDKYGGWLAYTVKKEAFQHDTIKDKKNKKEISHLIVRQLKTGHQDTLRNVKEFAWAEKAPVLSAIADDIDSTQTPGVFYLKDHRWKAVKTQNGEYQKLSVSPDGNRIAFIANHDTTKAQIPPFQLYYFATGQDSAVTIASQDESTLPLISQHADLSWSDNGEYLYYGRAEKPFIKDTSLLEDESVNVEIWSTNDPVLYTTQNVNRSAEEKRSYLHVFHTKTKQHFPVASLSYESAILTKDKQNRYAIVYTDRPYQFSVAWMGDAAKDIAIVDITTGILTPVKKGLLTSPALSPGGKYAYGYSDADSTWWMYHIENKSFSLLPRKDLPSVYDELNDIPGNPNPYGHAGWTKDDAAFIFYDRYDTWSLAMIPGSKLQRLSDGRNTKEIYRYIRTDPDEVHLPADKKWLFHVMNDETKSTAYAWYDPASKKWEFTGFEPVAYSKQVTKARNKEVYLFKKENFSLFPDLQITTDQFVSQTKISFANPQQKDYKWGTIELFEWMDWDSIMRRGLLVKPPGFDSLRSYPTIVNFYERYTDALHHHPTPEPHRSTINYAFYASRGYVIFNPDISYEVGKPGESAYKIVLSGVQELMKKRVADPQNLALQGHSWGGYQIAYIVSRTNMFKCAEAGASVVNMTSAYGGIRWGTGLSRMFQYELAQSRIGKTLWQDPQLYIANSPLFYIHKITTPLLLMHNDEDAAVPFEQGIEFYLALRRLGKTAWLLNYTGEPHWPVKWHNKKDFQIRMSQFFDHYLMGKPMPLWMEKGIPALQRGIERGY